MAEYIEREALRKLLFSYYDCVNESSCKSNYTGETLMAYEVADMINDCLDNAPDADVATVYHAKWVKMDMHKGIEQFKCSLCRSECYVPTCMGEPMYSYCPNCGAKMDGEVI